MPFSTHPPPPPPPQTNEDAFFQSLQSLFSEIETFFDEQLHSAHEQLKRVNIRVDVPENLGELPRRLVESFRGVREEIVQSLEHLEKSLPNPSSITLQLPPFLSISTSPQTVPPPPPPPPPPLTFSEKTLLFAKSRPYMTTAIGLGISALAFATWNYRAQINQTTREGYDYATVKGRELTEGLMRWREMRSLERRGLEGRVVDGYMVDAILILSPSPAPLTFLFPLTLTLLSPPNNNILIIAFPTLEAVEEFEERLEAILREAEVERSRERRKRGEKLEGEGEGVRAGMGKEIMRGLRVMVYDAADPSSLQPFHRSLHTSLTTRYPAPHPAKSSSTSLSTSFTLSNTASNPYAPHPTHLPKIKAVLNFYPLVPPQPTAGLVEGYNVYGSGSRVKSGNIPDLVQILQTPASSASSMLQQSRPITNGFATPKPILFTFVHSAATQGHSSVDFGLQLNTQANLLIGNNAVATATSVQVRVMQLFRAWFGGGELKANSMEGKVMPEGVVRKHVEVRVGRVGLGGLDPKKLVYGGIGISGVGGLSGNLQFLRNGYEALANSDYRLLRSLAPVHQVFSKFLQAMVLPLRSLAKKIEAFAYGQSMWSESDPVDEWRRAVRGLDKGMRGGWGVGKGIRLGSQDGITDFALPPLRKTPTYPKPSSFTSSSPTSSPLSTNFSTSFSSQTPSETDPDVSHSFIMVDSMADSASTIGSHPLSDSVVMPSLCFEPAQPNPADIRPYLLDTSGIDDPIPRPSSVANITSPTSPISHWPPSESARRASVSSAHPRKPSLVEPVGLEEDSPSRNALNGLLALSATYAAFGMYIVWAFLPGTWAKKLGLPSREWTVVIPAYLMAVAMFTYVGYVALMAYHTPSFDSISYIADARGLIPDTLAKSLVCDLRDLRPDSASLYQAGDEVNTNPHDLPVATVNRILYPPRKRT